MVTSVDGKPVNHWDQRPRAYEITRVRERLTRAAFLAPDLSEDLRGELSSITGRPFVDTMPAARSRCPVVVVGRRPSVDVQPGELVWFHTTNAGVDDVLAARALAEETLFTRTVGGMGRKVAEYVLAWMLARSQHVVDHDRQSRAREWDRLVPTSVATGTVIVFGAGRIGHSVSALLRATGIRVVGVARGPGRSDRAGEVRTLEQVRPLLPSASWIVSTLPLTDRTRGYFGQGIFSLLRGAYFINAGRGSTVEFEALREALEAGRVRGAVIDVLPAEPPAVTDRWWTLPNTTLTSHSAGITSDRDIAEAFSTCWRAIQRGERPELAVDAERGY